MSPEASTDSHLEIAHVLFIDIVGYSKLLIDQQTALVKELNEKVRNTEEFRAAEGAGKLIRIATGDGMALAFFTSPDAPVRCALQLTEVVRQSPRLPLRMGIHSGPVDKLADVNEQSNIAGSGINTAQRVMDCGDAGHILLSRRVADDLAQYGRWQPDLHNLGQVEVKHGVKMEIVNFYSEKVGNAAVLKKNRDGEEECLSSNQIPRVVDSVSAGRSDHCRHILFTSPRQITEC
jgi:hypothetical protein